MKFSKRFLRKLSELRCTCGKVGDDDIAVMITNDQVEKIFTVSIQCKCGKRARAVSTSFDYLHHDVLIAAEDSFLEILNGKLK